MISDSELNLFSGVSQLIPNIFAISTQSLYIVMPLGKFPSVDIRFPHNPPPHFFPKLALHHSFLGGHLPSTTNVRLYRTYTPHTTPFTTISRRVPATYQHGFQFPHIRPGTLTVHHSSHHLPFLTFRNTIVTHHYDQAIFTGRIAVQASIHEQDNRRELRGAASSLPLPLPWLVCCWRHGRHCYSIIIMIRL
ncbi:hypothetical protein EX30DRAFT_56711 [Ascodesmis nigricans]|uniref:Uncharacterized protein n=1 Tax=Ascodesmis nigricans TaxID=341454 RepID=A0A4S2MUR0_9PEZI|nr:hypothetical protein EX30DRAFT_56711 [Ascodesmis nigricans]